MLSQPSPARSLAALAFCFSTILYALSPERLILHPSTDRLAANGATQRFFPCGDGGKLEIWTGSSPRGRPGIPPAAYILRFYGNADRAEENVGAEAAQWSSTRTVEFWGVNYPGYGGSTGPASLASIAPAALAAYDALRQTAGARPIFVLGTSLGTTAALHVAAHRPVAGVVLQNPPPIREIILRRYGWWNLWVFAGPVASHIPAALNSLTNARAVRAPGVFVLAEKDTFVEPRFQRLVVDAYAGKKRIVPLPGAGHLSVIEGPALDEYRRAVDWLLANPAASTDGVR